jgi:hypothetical protein
MQFTLGGPEGLKAISYIALTFLPITSQMMPGSLSCGRSSNMYKERSITISLGGKIPHRLANFLITNSNLATPLLCLPKQRLEKLLHLYRCFQR